MVERRSAVWLCAILHDYVLACNISGRVIEADICGCCCSQVY